MMSPDIRFILLVASLTALCGRNDALTKSYNEDNYELNSGWTILNQQRSINVTDLSVPFSVHTALQLAGLIGDPFYRFNDIELRWIALDNGWTFV